MCFKIVIDLQSVCVCCEHRKWEKGTGHSSLSTAFQTALKTGHSRRTWSTPETAALVHFYSTTEFVTICSDISVAVASHTADNRHLVIRQLDNSLPLLLLLPVVPQKKKQCANGAIHCRQYWKMTRAKQVVLMLLPFSFRFFLCLKWESESE